MRAAVKEEPGPGFVWKEVPQPKPQAGEVLVRVRAVGICGTDLPIFDGRREVPRGLIPGHEFAGEIVQVGSEVQGWQVGDRVAVGLVKGCGWCPYCRVGNEPMCDNILELGIHVNGAYAEYVAVPQSCLHRLPENLSFEDGASVDPIASAYRGVRKIGVNVEDTVVIFGPGPIGLYALQTVRARGAHCTIVVGRPEDRARLEIARELGADHTVCVPEEDAVARVAEWTRGRMGSVVIEATGSAAALPLELACAGKGARVLLLGIFHDSVTLNPATIVRRELQVVGSFCYSWEDFEESLQLLARGKLTTAPMITHVLPLDQLEEGLRLMRERQAVKVILQP
ncbi:MAG: zinc-dependent alcohol dehydrogenase [Chloroflexia bacterium]